MKKKKLKKRIIIISVAVVLVIAAVVGIFFARKNSLKAYVQPVESLNMNMYIANANFYTGTVFESAQQNIFVSSTKKVEEVLVGNGDTVKKGDPLFRYDTTMLQLDVEEKQMSVDILDRTLKTEQQKLTEYNNIVPYVEPATEPPTEPDENAEEAPEAAEPVQEEPEPEQENATEEVHYTAQQKADMVANQQSEVRRAQNNLDAANQALAEAKEALDNATVYSGFDGVVESVQNPDSIDASSPFCKIIGDSGVTIKGYVNEFQRAELKVGETLNVTSYMTGNSTDAEVLSINDFPTDDKSVYGTGNQNASYYEFTAFMDDSENFSISEQVQIRKILSDKDYSNIVLEKVYVRSDDNGTYVMKDDNGVLKRQDVKCHAADDRNYIYITEGLTAEDMIAFPYGSKAVEGNLTTTEQAVSIL